jgi:hypothetical protein
MDTLDEKLRCWTCGDISSVPSVLDGSSVIRGWGEYLIVNCARCGETLWLDTSDPGVIYVGEITAAGSRPDVDCYSKTRLSGNLIFVLNSLAWTVSYAGRTWEIKPLIPPRAPTATRPEQADDSPASRRRPPWPIRLLNEYRYLLSIVLILALLTLRWLFPVKPHPVPPAEILRTPEQLLNELNENRERRLIIAPPKEWQADDTADQSRR